MSDIEVVEGIYAAMAVRDFDAVFQLLDPSLVLTQDDRLPWGGRYEGLDGFASFGAALGANIDSQVTIEAMFEADGDVVQMGHTRGTTIATGTPFDCAEVHRWTLRDGRAVRAHFSIDTAAMLAALGV